MGLYQLIYQSVSLVPFEPAQLTAMLSWSRAFNSERRVSGLLLHTVDGRFLQVLEGDREDVRHLYFDRIRPDPRHHQCRVFSEGPCPHRAFPRWQMGFRMAQAQDLRLLLSSVPSDIPGLLVPRPHTRTEIMALLMEFLQRGEVDAAQEHPW